MSTTKKHKLPDDPADSQDDVSAYLSPQIKGSEKKSVTAAWIGVGIFAFSVWWFTGWGRMPIFLPHDKYPNPIACILGIIGFLVLGKAICETIRLKRFGDPALELKAGKGTMGGMLEGQINFGPEMIHAPEFTVRLACLQSVQRPGNKNPTIIKRWSGEQKVSLMPVGILPISIVVPGDQPPTTNGDPFDRIYWQLTVKAPFFPVGFSEKYEVPVFDGGAGTLSAGGYSDSAQSPAYPSSQASRGFILLFLIPFLIGGAVLFYHGASDVQRAVVAQNGSVVAGRIVTSQIHYTGKRSSNYEPTIHYVYTVDDRIYTGSEVYPHWFWSHRTTQNAIDAFPLGSTTPIHYAPGHPERAMLQPGLRPGIFQGLICAGLALAFSGILATAFFAPAKDVIQQGNSITYQANTWESKVSGYCFLALIVLGLLLWYVT